MMNPDRPKSRQSMLVVTLPETQRTMGILFRHIHGKAFIRNEEKMVQMTRCSIFELFPPEANKEPLLITYGVAKCSPKDQFNREIGRKISLTRALIQGNHFLATPKEGHVTPEVKNDRTAIWWCYLNRGAVNTPEQGSAADQPAIEGQVITEQKLLPESTLTTEPVTVH